MKNYFTPLILLLILTASCKKADIGPVILSPPNFLTGTWIYSNIEDEVQIMQRSDSLLKNRYGFTMFPDGSFLERKSSGWCGQGGDYIFEDYEGKWLQLATHSYKVKVGYCEGEVEYIINVNYVDIDSLRFVYEFSQIFP